MSSAFRGRAVLFAAIAFGGVVVAGGARVLPRGAQAAGAGADAPSASAPSTPIAAGQSQPPLHDARDLWVCADPNNLPFSDASAQGFENQIAKLVADDLGRRLRYFWEPQRRGFVRTTLKAANCDLVIGVPSTYELVETTRPYYESTYVFVSRRDRGLRVHTFDDPRLEHAAIGIQIVGDDYANPPAAQALAFRHAANVRGFSVYGDYSRAAPQRAIIDAVAAGSIDVAVAWGPLAGYFASRSRTPLEITAVTPPVDRFGLPFAFEISMGVRRGAIAFRAELDDLIVRRHLEIETILRRFGVPLVEDGG